MQILSIKKNGDNDTQLQMQEWKFFFFLCQVTDITFWSVWSSICSPHACDKKKAIQTIQTLKVFTTDSFKHLFKKKIKHQYYSEQVVLMCCTISHCDYDTCTHALQQAEVIMARPTAL